MRLILVAIHVLRLLSWVFVTALHRPVPEFAQHPEFLATLAIKSSLEHDSNSFTQGLMVYNGRLYESTGLYGQSSVQILDLTTGQRVAHKPLPSLYFGEGMTIIGGVIYLLTWREHVMLKLNASTLETVSTHAIKTVSGEGWGITHADIDTLIVSDGTDHLYFWDATTLREIRRIDVTFQGQAVPRLNELEFIDGYVYANVWYTDWIVKIDPSNGEVVLVYDIRGLYRPTRHGDVLNGIAFNQKTRELIITGKRWPTIYIATLPGYALFYTP